jgi:hypothetical protein
VLQVIWRVEALALPPLLLACPRCAGTSSFVCTERFRVNANGGRLDVWLLYQCLACAETHKQRVLRRARVAELSRELLEGYQGDEPALVRRWAFASGRGAEVPFCVERPPLAPSGLLRARIEQPEPCGARWDRLLASELGWSRAQVARAVERGLLRVNGGGGVRRAVADGDDLEVALGATQSG